MAGSSHKAAHGPGAALALGVLLAVAATAAPYDAQAPIDLQAASSDFDYRNNTLVFRRVTITQGGLRVEAQEANASGLEFVNSQWTFRGQVRITVPDGKLSSDTATVTFRDNQIVEARIRGTPAQFEQRLKDNGQLAQGRATSIEYDVRNDTVKLAGQAWLTDGQNEIRGETLIYDIGRQRVAANPGATEPGGVRITINPKESAPKEPGTKQPVTQEPATPPTEAPPQ